jgi:hypothetical protein
VWPARTHDEATGDQSSRTIWLPIGLPAEHLSPFNQLLVQLRGPAARALRVAELKASSTGADDPNE